MDLYYPVPRLDKGLLNDAILSLNREVIMAQYGFMGKPISGLPMLRYSSNYRPV